jgi:hypothetical protein
MEADEKYREWLEKNKQKPTESASAGGEEGQEKNSDQSVY